MTKKKQNNKSFLVITIPYAIGSLIIYIIIRLILNGFSLGNVGDILIYLAMAGALILLYTIGYFIVIIYEKFEKRRKI